MATHPGRDHGTWQTEGAAEAILRRAHSTLETMGHIWKSGQPTQSSFLQLWFPRISLLLPPGFLPWVLPVVWKEGLCDPESLPHFQSWGSPRSYWWLSVETTVTDVGKAQGGAESLPWMCDIKNQKARVTLPSPLLIGFTKISVILLKSVCHHPFTLPSSLCIPNASAQWVYLCLLFYKETCPLSQTSHWSKSHHSHRKYQIDVVSPLIA